MPITHTNRKGVIYYLHEGKTRTGKPRYHFSKDSEADLVDAIPEGYEIYENPNAQVYLRRIVSRNVRPEDAAVIEAGIRRHAGLTVFRLEMTRDAIEVYMPDKSIEEIQALAIALGGCRLSDERALHWQRGESFSRAFRFELQDRETRHFSVQRWCYRGGTEGWTYDLASGALEALVKKYSPHLGKESFFDLM